MSDWKKERRALPCYREKKHRENCYLSPDMVVAWGMWVDNPSQNITHLRHVPPLCRRKTHIHKPPIKFPCCPSFFTIRHKILFNWCASWHAAICTHYTALFLNAQVEDHRAEAAGKDPKFWTKKSDGWSKSQKVKKSEKKSESQWSSVVDWSCEAKQE